MIGNWLETLDDEQLGRLLTTRCVHGQHEAYRANVALDLNKPMCLLEVAYNTGSFMHAPVTNRWDLAIQYDRCCGSFGLERVNAAVRNRCLRILARRNVPAPVMEVAAC